MWIDQLTSPDTQARETAAYHVFVENPNSLAGDERAAQALQELLASGEPSTAAILLSSFAPGDRTLDSLRRVKHDAGDQPAKLHPWSQPVALRWAANLALSRLGDDEARSALLGSAESASTDERLLMLDAIDTIDDPPLLHQVAKYLSDEAEISRGVPSGAEPRRRVQDYAVDRLAGRLKLALSFPLNSSGRYTPEQIEETRRLIRRSVPL